MMALWNFEWVKFDRNPEGNMSEASYGADIASFSKKFSHTNHSLKQAPYPSFTK